MTNLFCIVLALLCVLIGLFEYLRPRVPPANCCTAIFWPLLGLLIVEICRMLGTAGGVR